MAGVGLHLLRVFCRDDGEGGNPLGVFLDGGTVPAGERQAVAAALGFSETVFVDDAASGGLRIFTPTVELTFAGHPLVGAAWLLARERTSLTSLSPPAGEVPTRVEGERTFVAAPPAWAPPFAWVELSSPGDVEALAGPPDGHDLIGAYAWAGEQTVRARVFCPRLGIEEDEATGAAAVRLGGLLRRPFTIRQGRGSVIEVRPRPEGLIEVGGHVALDEVRPYSPSIGDLTNGR